MRIPLFLRRWVAGVKPPPVQRSAPSEASIDSNYGNAPLGRDWESDIYAAIRNHTETDPVSLWSIIACVDHLQRILITQDELSRDLRSLIEAGSVAEAGPHKYYDAAGLPASKTFSGVSPEAYSKGCSQYQEMAEQVSQDFDSEDYSASVTVHLRSSSEDLAQALSDKLNKLVEKCGEDGMLPISGWMGGGGEIEILVSIKREADLDKIYPSILSAVKSLAPPGSSIDRWNEATGKDDILFEVPKAEPRGQRS